MHSRYSPKDTQKSSSNSKKSVPPTKSSNPVGASGTTPSSSSSPYLKPKQFPSFKYGGIDEESYTPYKAKEAYCSASKRSTMTSSSSTAFKVGTTAGGGGVQSKKAAAEANPIKSKSKLGKSPSRTGGVKKLPVKKIASTSSPRPTPPSSARKHPLPSSQLSQQRKGECEVCKQICRSHCAGCKRVFYCSKQHQQQDWATHKLACRDFSIPPQYNSAFHLRPPGVSSSTSLTSQQVGSKSSELQFMITTKQINPGNIIFIEKPLFVASNMFDADFSLSVCGACLQARKESDGGSTSTKLTICSKCTMPLCQDCHNDPNGNGSSKRFHAGQGHSPEECAFIAEFMQKHPEVLNFRTGMDENGNPYNFMKDLAVLRILLFRSLCPWRYESILALKNSPRFIACCKHNFGSLNDWMVGFSLDFVMSQYYFKNICKEKNIPLTDVVKILAVFCEASFHNPSYLVLYENRSWIAHCCTPNAEQFIRQVDDQTLEIIVKAVNTIGESSKVFLNYLPDFEGGVSALAVKLFQSKGMYCSDSTCPCYQGGYDKTLGIRCDLIPSDECHACSGILSPCVEAPNPEKNNLGLGMFLKSKKWECDKCKKSERYGQLHGKIMEVAQELTQGCETVCKQRKGQGFLQLRNKLLANLSDQHWMVWKAKLRILTTWNTALGYGNGLLQRATSLAPGSLERENLLPIIKQKGDLYGEGIYDSEDKSKPVGKGNKGKLKSIGGMLDLIGRRHGHLSSARGEMLFDAFYANLILLIEDYKKELPLEPRFTVKRNQISGETCKKLQILKDMLEQTVECLKVGEVTSSQSKDNSHLLRTAVQSLNVLTSVCNRLQQLPNSVIGSMNELLELYACQDTHFVSTALKQSQHKKRDPCLNGLDLEFEIDKDYCGNISLTFGTSISSTPGIGAARIPKTKTRFQKANHFSADRKSTFGSSFSAGESSSFFSSSSRFGKNDTEGDADEDEDDDDDDFYNPFVYSGSAAASHSSSKSNKSTKNKTASSGSSKQGKSSSNPHDWSTLFDMSSDEDDDEDFDFGFMGSTPDFEDDLFNNDTLEDLAEWAALQFMMGKMQKP